MRGDAAYTGLTTFNARQLRDILLSTGSGVSPLTNTMFLLTL